MSFFHRNYRLISTRLFGNYRQQSPICRHLHQHQRTIRHHHQPRMVTHVLFDFDGTMVNSIDNIVNIVDRVIQEHNPQKRINDVVRDYIPNLHSFHKLIELINTEMGLTLDHDHYTKVISREARIGLEFLPGVERLVKHLHKHRVPMAVATGADRACYELGISNYPEFFNTYISHAVCAWDDPDVPNRKPAPDCYHVAKSKFPDAPDSMEQVLIFEDSITGLQGATASGGKTVFVSKWKSMFSEENQPHIEKAVLVLDSMEHFKPEQFGLPPFED